MDFWRRETSQQLTQAQLDDIVVIERVCSTLSLLGCTFIMASFLGSKAFHRPINRLVFFASIGNIMTNIATIMARSTLLNLNGFLCQFQAFLIQMFMPADAYWTLAMACNVYLTFYWKFDASRLRRIEPIYIACCYGIPFVPAFVYLWIKTGANGRFYGNAVLWCWVSSDWDIWRILTFYGPVWVVIIVTIAIYLRAGVEIYKRRKQLRRFNTYTTEPTADADATDIFMSIKTTEVSITTEQINPPFNLDLGQINRSRSGRIPANRPGSPGLGPAHGQDLKDEATYTVSISSNAEHLMASRAPTPILPSPTFSPNTEKPSESNQNLRTPTFSYGSGGGESSPTPPTPSRSFIKKRLGQASTVPPTPSRRNAMEANTAAWGYTKVALLFFTAMLVTWMPSSANRLYSLLNPGQISVPLEFASALVLPLQGFWNALIYVITSWTACKTFWGEIFSWRGRRVGGSSSGGGGAGGVLPLRKLEGLWGSDSKGGQKSTPKADSLDNESTTELTSRPPSRSRE